MMKILYKSHLDLKTAFHAMNLQINILMEEDMRMLLEEEMMAQ